MTGCVCPPTSDYSAASIRCPWCQSNVMDELEDTSGDNLTCPACRKDFELVHIDGEVKWQGVMTEADLKYLEWKASQ